MRDVDQPQFTSIGLDFRCVADVPNREATTDAGVVVSLLVSDITITTSPGWARHAALNTVNRHRDPDVEGLTHPP
jgi:hypothetical protein